MNLKMNYELLKNMYEELGIDKFFKLFEKTYKDFNLYTVSKDWINSKEYILKFKGAYGDLIIYWN